MCSLVKSTLAIRNGIAAKGNHRWVFIVVENRRWNGVKWGGSTVQDLFESWKLLCLKHYGDRCLWWFMWSCSALLSKIISFETQLLCVCVAHQGTCHLLDISFIFQWWMRNVHDYKYHWWSQSIFFYLAYVVKKLNTVPVHTRRL